MSLDVGAALRDGAERTLARTGLVLMGAFAVLGTATAIVQQTYLEWYAGFLARNPEAVRLLGGENPETPLSLGLPLGATLAGMLVVAVAAEAVRIVAVRTMVGDHTDAIPLSLVWRNLPLATLNGFVGGVVVAVVVGVGAVLVVPAVFFAVSFVFVRQEIAVQDRNFVDAMKNSWALAGGNRVQLLVLGLVWVSLYLLVLVGAASLGSVPPADSPAGPLLGVALRVPVVVFVVATASRAYVQVTDAEAAADEPPADEAEDDEWNDPPGVDL